MEQKFVDLLKENDEQNIKILDAKYLMPFFVSERNDVKIKSKCIDVKSYFIHTHRNPSIENKLVVEMTF